MSFDNSFPTSATLPCFLGADLSPQEIIPSNKIIVNVLIKTNRLNKIFIAFFVYFKNPKITENHETDKSRLLFFKSALPLGQIY